MNLPPGIEALPNGEWVVIGDTHLSNWAKQHGTIVSDPHLFKWLKPHLKDVKVVWDCGAAIGDHTRAYLDMGKTVVAFEPNPQAFLCLAHNCKDAKCHNVAVSSATGKLRFTPLDNMGASRITLDGPITVSAVPLDSMDLPAPNFIKLDVEGHEVSALIGMAQTLNKNLPTLFVEVNRGALAENGHSSADITNLLRDLGYSSFEVYPPTATWQDEQFDILVK